MQDRDTSKALSAAVSRLLRPLVRILLRNGVPFRAFSDLAQQVYVDVAMQDFQIQGRKPSISRASVLTGLSRKRILEIRRAEPSDDSEAIARYNRAARVVTGWIRDGEFHGSDGPLDLPFDGEGRTFSELVRRYSGDVPPRATLDELLRVGAVERTESGLIRLRIRAYVPRGDEVEKIGILGTDVADLIGTIDHNLRADGGEALFQRAVTYDNLSVEAVEEFRPLAAERAQEFLEFLDAWLSLHDRDVNPDAKGTGRMRAGVGVYYFEEDLSGESEGQEEAS